MILDLGNGYQIRQATAGDHPALLSVCLRTAADGKDATAREDDPDLVGLYYAVPYQALEPELSFVLDGPEGVEGYVLGALDSVAFNRRFENEWLAPLRARVRKPDEDREQWTGSDWARALIHRAPPDPAPALAGYPSHGHIDLLPAVQGKGFGRKLMELLFARLAAAGSPGMHLGVSPRNRNALAFYERVGFSRAQGDGIPRTAYFMVKGF